MNTEAFVYKWTHKETKRFYIGKHKGTIDDGYISSGKAFLDCYNVDPNNFERQILFFGSNQQCLEQEGLLIRQAIQEVGYKNIYNLTHYSIIQGWKRTCLHCGKWCDPANEDWAYSFAQYHFEFCKDNPRWLTEAVKKEPMQSPVINTKLSKMDIALMSEKQLNTRYNQLVRQIKNQPKNIKVLQEERSEIMKNLVILRKNRVA